MSNNDLSIDEILKEAEEVLNRIGRTTKETIEQIKSVDEPLEPVDDVKTYDAGDKPVREYTLEKRKPMVVHLTAKQQLRLKFQIKQRLRLRCRIKLPLCRVIRSSRKSF